MNRRMILNMMGQIMLLEAGLMLFPLVVSLIYGESKSIISFGITILLSVATGLAFMLIKKAKNKVIFAKEGFLIVALAWMFMSAIGALPFVLSKEIPSYVDAFFETVSGFTTTGASILTDVEAMSRGMLFWRSFTHWIGGMGVLVMIVAIVPAASGRSIHILRAEMPGPTMGKLVPKIKDTALILYIIYFFMTVIEIVLLLIGGMPFFDSVVHAFGTAGTGGFGIKGDSIAGYNNYLQWVITIFMALFGINFNIFYLILMRRFKAVLHSTELWTYLGIILASVTAITINIYPLYHNISQAIRLSSFQVSSIITTTGFSTADFNQWPELSKALLLMLMFIGACAGSTGGGLKVSRVILLVGMIKKEFRRLLHPRSVGTIKFEAKSVDEKTQSNVSVYFAIYVAIFCGLFLLISFDKFDVLTNISAVAACYNNIGPGLGAVGPAASYAGYSVFSKLLLSFAMLLGRLEIYPMVFLFYPKAWTGKR